MKPQMELPARAEIFLDILATEDIVMATLYSYIIVYDSGFAPNPFNGFCTLATCKQGIRKHACLGDWVVGTGSKQVQRDGFLVYSMRVRETLSFTQYWNDSRFEKKKPNLYGSYRMAYGDNIYFPLEDGKWGQLDSCHSNEDGSLREEHLHRDMSVDRVLISDDFVYFGGMGPEIPDSLKDIVHKSRQYKVIKDQNLIKEFESWLESLHAKKYQGRPFDMMKR